MRCFIKTEKFKEEILSLPKEERRDFVLQHKDWVAQIKSKGIKASSGYLVNRNNEPGGGGLLIIYCDSYDEAIKIVSQDPMIKNNLVKWELNEWISIHKTSLIDFIEGNLS